MQALGFSPDGGTAVQRLAVDTGHADHADSADHAGASAVHDVLRRAGRPLPVAVRHEMESRLGADFSDVRLHTDRAARESAAAIGARAYTSGNHIVIGEAGSDRHTLAHELSHVLQQRRGPVSGTDHGSGLKLSDPADRFEREAEATATRALAAGPTAPTALPAPGPDSGQPGGADAVIQRTIVFEPFTDLQTGDDMPPGAPDVLINHGLTYPDGGTLGNQLLLEKMHSDTGGGSAPGEPTDITTIRLIHSALIRANGQQNAATAMHAINGDFHQAGNYTADNIFMGSAKSNTQEHFNKVERPIRASMQKGTKGLAAAYDHMMANDPPTPLDGSIVGWEAPGRNIPGASSSPADLAPIKTDFPTVTHVVDLDDLADNPEGRWPKLIEYVVTPHYTYQQYPHLPQFLMDNIKAGEALITAEQAKPPGAQNVNGILEEQKAIDILKLRAHLLFPQTFSCYADYYIASYNPSHPWDYGHDAGIYDAEV